MKANNNSDKFGYRNDIDTLGIFKAYKKQINRMMQKPNYCNISNYHIWHIFILLFILLISNGSVVGQSSITAIGTAVTQDFNTLSSSTTNQTWTNNVTLTGWYTKTDATSPTQSSPTQYKANQGSNITAFLYSFGSTGASDRAFGYFPSDIFTGVSGVGKGYMGWRLKNNTTKTIGSIRIVWSGEQWRKAVDANIQYITLSYQIGTTVTDLTSGTYILSNSTFASPIHTALAAVILDGNNAANRTAGITYDVDVEIPVGAEIMLRWEDLNDPANHTLAIDDVSFTATKEAQSITFPTLADKTYGDAPFPLTAISSSGLTVAYSSSDPSVATISGNVVTLTGAGMTTITASQSGTATFAPATIVERVLNVKPQAPVATAASGIGAVSLTANWSTASGATAYYLYFSDDPTFATYTAASVGSVTSFTQTSLLPNTTYYYRLKSINTGIYSDYSNTISAATIPGTQTHDISAIPSPTSVTLNWINGNLTSRVVFVKEGTGTIANPENGNRYYESTDWGSPGDQLGSSGYYCVYYGTGTTVDLTNLSSSTLYSVQAFEFDGDEYNELYLTSVAGTNNPITFTTTGITNKWKGSVSTDWNTAGNWTAGTVPLPDANIIFDDAPVHHCYLDQDRQVGSITNATAYRMVLNGHQLMVKGNLNFTNGAQIDASATSSKIDFAGSSAQVIPAGTFYNDEVYDLNVNNGNYAFLYGTLRLLHSITATTGRLDAYTNTPSVVYAGTATQTIESGRYLSENIYNLTIDNVTGVELASTAAINVPHDLTITTGVLTVPPGALLTVVNATNLNYRAPLPTSYPKQIDYWSCLVLKSSATATGSFIHSDTFTGTGSVKVERYMSKTDRWHLYSSPIGNQSIKNFLKYNAEIPDLLDINTNVIAVGMRNYLTTTDVWNSYIVYGSADTDVNSMKNGKGFSIRTTPDGSGTGSLDANGYPNSNSVNNVTLARTSNSTDKGWNCIGNPYTSAINIKYDPSSDGFLNANNLSQLEAGFEGVYVWDTNNITSSNTTPEYIVLNNASSITSIQIGQGFFVKSKAGGGSVNFNKNMQNPNYSLTFKDAVIAWPSIKLFAKNTALSSSTEIKFITNTTKGLDAGYDAGMLKANPDFALYSKLLVDNVIDFTLQCLPDQNYDQYVIPIGLDCKVAGNVTFTAETINLPSGCEALLEDRLTKRFTRLDLKDASYTATISADTKGPGRFYLHTSDVISGTSTLEESPFKVYTVGKTIYINGDVSDQAIFSVYSMNGKQLANFTATSQVQNTFDATGISSGAYILTVDDKKQKKSVKFVIEN